MLVHYSIAIGSNVGVSKNHLNLVLEQSPFIHTTGTEWFGARSVCNHQFGEPLPQPQAPADTQRPPEQFEP